MTTLKSIYFHEKTSAYLERWKVRKGFSVQRGTLIATYRRDGSDKLEKLKSDACGYVDTLKINEGQQISLGSELLTLTETCSHPTVMKDMCAECGADLRSAFGVPGDRKMTSSASVAMVHSIPELIVSEDQALEIGKEDNERLLKERKLVLLVDLDQTLIHTTNDRIPANLKDVFHFQLHHGPHLLWYHTRFRPGTEKFLEVITKQYELHICTFGSRIYAHTIAKFLDPEGKYFSHRILSRDECFDSRSKTANLKALFPLGDSMVSIIDDREDVWRFAPNLIHVPPYIFFDGTADINAPPGMDKGADGPNKQTMRKTSVIRIPRSRQSSTDSLSSSKSDEMHTDTPSTTSDALQSDENALDKSANIDNQGSSDTAEDGASVPSLEQVNRMDTDSPAHDSEKDNEEIKKDNEGDEVKANDTGKDDDEIKKDCEDVAVKKNDTGKDDDEIKKDCEGVAIKKNDTGKEGDSKEEDGGDKNTKDDTQKGGNGNEEYDEFLDWEDGDDYLIYLQDVLARIHTAFYKVHDELKSNEKQPDLKDIIPYVKRKTLKGANILFSGIVPLNTPPEKCKAYQLALSLGAQVHEEFIPRKKAGDDRNEWTTHVVAARPGTAKVKAALKDSKVNIVNVKWLYSCSYRWEWVDEKLFILEGLQAEEPGKKRKRKIKKRSDTKVRRTDTNNSKECDEEVDCSDSDSTDEENQRPAQRERKFSDSYNPLLAFTSDQIADMDMEVNNVLSESSSSDEEAADAVSEKLLREKVLGYKGDSSSEDSLSGEYPHGWGSRKGPRKRKDTGDIDRTDRNDEEEEFTMKTLLEKEEGESFLKEFDGISSDSDKSEGDESIDDEMAAALEREFLSLP